MDNAITIEQWDQIAAAVNDHAKNSHQYSDVIYSGETLSYPKTRHYIYDNYDRYDSPGLDFVIHENNDMGRLTVYNGSEQAYAPINFDDGLKIANNFFNAEGSMMAEEIVCEYVMDDNPRINLWKQEDCNL